MRFRRACRRKRLEEERGVAITKGFLAQGKAVGTGDAPAAMFLLILLRLLLGLLGRSAPDVAVPDLENPPEAYRKEVVVGEIHVLTSFLSVPRIGRNQKYADGHEDRVAGFSGFWLIAFRAHCIMPLPPVGVDDAWVRYL